MLYTFADLENAFEKSGKQYDIERIRRAYELAEKAHEGQKRKSGEPYIIHPVAVSIILVGLGMDSDTIIAGLLHDVVEDTDVPLETIEKNFGEDVALMVNGVTKLTLLGKRDYLTHEEEQAENVRKMLIAMAQDARVIIIKLADRLHNMRTIQYRNEQKRRDTAKETMDIYAPLAHRLGIRSIKEELEDLCLRELDPVGYSEIEKNLELRKDDRDKLIDSIKHKIIERLNIEHQKVYIDGRVKSIYGIYRKMYIQGKMFDEIYDIYAVRIIVDTVAECYGILGIIHEMFRPIPNRIKDYISTPKANMYQSLHTTVLDKEGIPFEVQIRTWEMHYTAEYGIAAHWKYKAGINGKDKLEERLSWVRQLLENQRESGDVEDIVRSIKTDLAPEEVFAFTPKGDVIPLPTGSTVIDFAYAIHTAVGNRMIGAKVDGRMVAIDTEIKTGMIVEIITSSQPNHGPNRNWLKIVKTSGARNKIRAWFKKEQREENITEGKAELEREFKRNLITLNETQLNEFLIEIAKRQGFNCIEDFYAAIGYGGIQLSKIMPRIKDDYIQKYRTKEQEKQEAQLLKPKKSSVSSGVIVDELEGCLVKFARCCNPIPGDEIIGFVTRGYGVSIHKKDCINVISTANDPEQEGRWVSARWSGESTQEKFKAAIEIIAEDRPGLLADISIALANVRVPVHSLNARELKDKYVSINIVMSINNLDQLNNIMNMFTKSAGVIKVQRAYQ